MVPSRRKRAMLSECSAVPAGTACYTLVDNATRVVWPAICPGPSVSLSDASPLLPPHHLRNAPPGRLGYDFADGCSPDMVARNLSWLLTSHVSEHAPPAAPLAAINVGCQAGEDPNAAMDMILVWIILGLFMFYGLAHVCEEFLVPALNVLCERCNIPEDVAGAVRTRASLPLARAHRTRARACQRACLEPGLLCAPPCHAAA